MLVSLYLVIQYDVWPAVTGPWRRRRSDGGAFDGEGFLQRRLERARRVDFQCRRGADDVSATIAGIAAQDATPAASPAAMAEFAPDAAAGKTFGLIQKSGDQEYFVDEAQGFREVIEGAGGKVIVQDVQLDANAAINAVDTMISSGVAGIAIVVP